jgi:hypothetical protein
MRMEAAAQLAGGTADSALRCGGFFVVWLDDRPSVRLLPGDRLLSPAIPQALVSALEESPELVADALGLRAAVRPWDRVEVAIASGSRTQGEALPLGSGCIRLIVGEESPSDEVARLARHEALHLLLASTLRGGEKWCDPDLAFADWVVRGIEARREPGLPRLGPPWPGMLEALPRTRLEAQERLRALVSDDAGARRYFGDLLVRELRRIGEAGEADAVEQRQLWLVEAALGAHYLEAAAKLWTGNAGALRPLLLDDWLIDYEQYARGVANPPFGAGHLWQIADAEWSREPIVRLSVAAQALQRDDHCAFADCGAPADALVWKNRGRVRLPLVRGDSAARLAPIHGFRSALRALRGGEVQRASAIVEEAARGVEGFEARALWPRILSRLLCADLRWPEVAPAAVAAVQIVDAPEPFDEWANAAESLRAILGERGAWIPRVLPPRSGATIARAPSPPASVLLVHGEPPAPASLLAARTLAARIPVRGALYLADRAAGAAYEQLPDLEDPIDPRYREEAWVRGEAPRSLADLPRLADEATREGRPTTPLSWLLAISAIGLEECHYPRAPGPAPSAARP